MTVSEQSGDNQNKSVEELQKELDALKTSYEKLDTAHNKLKDDHRDLKATSSDATDLQKQLDKALTDKSKLIKEKDELAGTFETFKKELQKKDLKLHVSTALEAAGAKNSSTAMKLLDLDAIKFDENGDVVPESVAEVINAVQTSDPILFWQEGENRPDPKSVTTPAASTVTTPTAPSVKPAVQVVTKSAYETEMAEAVKSGKQENVDAVAQKYLKTN